MMSFIIRAAATYMVGELVVGIGEAIWKTYVRKINKEENGGCYTHCVGFEVEPGVVYEDDSDRGEFVIKGFVVE